MAIEVTPPEKVNKTQGLDIFLYILVILVIIFFVSYVLFGIGGWRFSNRLIEIKQSLQRTEAERNLEKEMQNYYKKINSFSNLLNSHQLPANLFTLLENNTHPKVWFSSFDLDLAKKSLSLAGGTENFETLGQQFLVFKKNEMIKNLNLTGISMGKDGKVEFTIQLSFDPLIFK